MRIQILKMYIPNVETEQFTYLSHWINILRLQGMLVQRWSDVVYSGPTLIQHLVSAGIWQKFMEQYNCITCMRTIILVMFVVFILNKGRTVNNKKIRNEEKKSDLLVFYIVIISWFQLAGYIRQFNKRVWKKSDIFCGRLWNGNMVRFTIKPALMILALPCLLYISSDFFVF